MSLLLKDANRVAVFHGLEVNVTNMVGLMRLYEVLIKRAGAKKEFPRLYRWAWITLATAIERNDWDLLLTINQIYQRIALPIENLRESGQFSEWHLKSILYCWLYLPSEGPSGKERRGEDGVDGLVSLISRCHAFLNLLPKEAERKLTTTRLDNSASSFQRPYLFRLSTNDPGIITMTYHTPFSDRPVHRRIQNPEEDVTLWLENKGSLYRTLFDLAVREKLAENNGHPLLLRSENLVVFMKEPMIDPFMSDTRKAFIKKKLEKQIGEKRVSLDGKCFSLFYRLFYTDFVELLVEPATQAEQLGLSDNYLHSYSENSTNSNDCLTCYKETSIAPIREAICGRTYCSSYCYNVSFTLSY